MTPTTTPAPPTAPVTPPAAPPGSDGGRVLLRGVDWATYRKLLSIFAGRRNPRLTYDRGALEIMAPSMEHEDDADALGVFVNVLAEELGRPLRRGGSTTLKRRKLLRGVEADRCYWVAHAAAIAGVRRIDLRVHPPPDLAIEVDVTGSSINKRSVYAKLGVPELWRLDGDDLRFYLLGPGRTYAEVAASVAFPGITPADLMTYLKQNRAAADQTVASIAFRAWVRQRVAAQAPPPAAP